VIPEKLKRLFFALEDRLFDLSHKIETRGVVPPAESAAHAQAQTHATSYQAVWTRNLRVLIGAAAKAGPARIFVDIGAGKGKACIYASRHFLQVIGVEYSSDLIAAARRNQQRSGRHNIEFIQADAAHYDVPDESTLIFLFNPFDDVILGQFITRNRTRIKACRSLIAYANDVQREILMKSGFECLFRDELRNISLWR
jgi:SAM-dependent methyltransferase